MARLFGPFRRSGGAGLFKGRLVRAVVYSPSARIVSSSSSIPEANEISSSTV
jgi:hypothetical protein